MKIINENIKRSEFESPIYSIERVPVFDLVAQSFNPNSLNSKSFSALQISLKNNGFAMCVTACENQVYDPNIDAKYDPFTKLKMHIEGSEADAKSGSVTGDTAYATQISDTDMRKAFRVELIDGAQRSGTIRMGTYLFMQKTPEQQEAMASKWSQGIDIPEDAGKDMLMYLAWRENFSVPCAILKGKSDSEKMSATILFNTARGSHSLDSMKDIVANLINVAGMSEEWVAKNLFLDLESVKRMTQLSGLKQAYDNIDAADLSWNPFEDESYERKTTAYLNREAAKYIQNYLKTHPDANNQARDMGDIITYAESLGWNKSAAEAVFQGK